MTDERWEHIIERHPEMDDYKNYIEETIKNGKRKQDDLDPNKYKYSAFYDDLPNGNMQIIVWVKMEYNNNKQNNFVLTAYMR
jgi:hypothetical protein